MATRQLQPNKRGASDKRLTPRELIFVKAMQADPKMDPTAAAKTAGYAHPSQRANDLMKKPAVKAILGKELHQRAEKFEIKADAVLQELYHLAMARGEDCFDAEGSMLPIKDMPDRAKAALKQFKVTEKIVAGGKKGEQITIRVTDVEFHDKKGSLDMLMKHLGQYELDNNQKPTMVFDLSSLYQRPAVKDPVNDAITRAINGHPVTTIVESPKAITHDIDEFEGEETV